MTNVSTPSTFDKTMYTLTPLDDIREVINEEKAQDLISNWSKQLSDYDPTKSIKISLSGKTYTPAAAKIISSFITDDSGSFNPSISSQVTIADIADVIASQMEVEGLEVLKTFSEAFASSRLVEVDLSDNAMGSKGVKSCEMVLGGEAVIHSLQKLKLCNNGLSEDTMHEVADFLTRTNIGSNNTIAENLTQIHFYNNMSGDKGCDAFGKIMQSCTSKIEDIRMSGTRAKTAGSYVIAQSLESMAKNGKLSNLQKLDLADNTFTESAELMAIALSSCSNLTYLNLKDCVLGDDGIALICSALIDAGCPLTHLDLGGNEISAQGSKDVAKLLKRLNNTIQVFNAEDNEMTSAGIRSICNVLSSESLRSINLSCNECGKIGATAIMKSKKVLPNLSQINIDGNMFSEEIVSELVELFGDSLVEMEDNDEDEDVDESLESSDDESSSADSSEVVESKDVDALGAALGHLVV